MGDRCYLKITCLKKDADRFKELGLVEDEERGGTVELSKEEANYGLWQERETLAKAGVVFVGWHSEGGDYAAAAFASDGKTLAEIPTLGNDGEPCVALNEKGKPDAGGMKAFRAYRAAKKRAEAVFGNGAPSPR